MFVNPHNWNMMNKYDSRDVSFVKANLPVLTNKDSVTKIAGVRFISLDTTNENLKQEFQKYAQEENEDDLNVAQIQELSTLPEVERKKKYKELIKENRKRKEKEARDELIKEQKIIAKEQADLLINEQKQNRELIKQMKDDKNLIAPSSSSSDNETLLPTPISSQASFRNEESLPPSREVSQSRSKAEMYAEMAPFEVDTAIENLKKAYDHIISSKVPYYKEENYKNAINSAPSSEPVAEQLSENKSPWTGRDKAPRPEFSTAQQGLSQAKVLLDGRKTHISRYLEKNPERGRELVSILSKVYYAGVKKGINWASGGFTSLFDKAVKQAAVNDTIITTKPRVEESDSSSSSSDSYGSGKTKAKTKRVVSPAVLEVLRKGREKMMAMRALKK